MATLEKIRSKSVLLFTVIIVALLAFILGDFFTSGRSLFGGDTTVGEIGDHEVDVQLYQQRLSELTQGGQYKDDYLYWAQDSLLRAMLYDQMLDEEWEKAGIYVTDKELADYVLKNGDNILRMMYGPNNQIALIPFNVYVDMVKNPSKFGASAENVEQFKNIIAGVEKQAEKVIKGRVYEYMFQGLFTANNLDAKEAFDAKYNNYNISFTSTELSTLKDEDFQVSDDEIKAEWEKNKKAYELEGETRSIKYFTVMITPSADDYTAAENAVNEAIVGLNEKPGVEAIAENFDFIVKTRTYSPRQIQEPQLRSFVDSAKVGEVAVVSRLDKTYRLAKLISAKQEMDDVNISVIATTEATVFDSIITDFKNNTTIGDLINKNKGNVNVGVSDSTWIYLADNNVSKNLKEKLLNAKVGEEVLDTLDNGGTKEYYLYVVNERTPDVKISEVAEIEYTIKPSDKTISEINSKLEKFLAENKTVEDLVKNAPKAGYSISPYYIDAHSFMVGFNPQVYYSGVPESRSAIKWAMNAEKGEISAPFANESRILVVAVTGIYEDYLTTDDEQVKESLIAKIRDDKKAEKIIADLKSKKVNDLDGYAALTGVAITDNVTISFSNTSVPTLGGNEYAFVGAVAGAKEGDLIGPMKTNKAVVVAKVNSITPMDENVTYTYKEGKYHFSTANTNRLLMGLFGILKGNNKYENNLLDFYEK